MSPILRPCKPLCLPCTSQHLCAAPLPCSIHKAPTCRHQRGSKRNPGWAQPGTRQGEDTDVGLLHHSCSSHPSPMAAALTQMRGKHPGEQEVEGGSVQPFLAAAQVAKRWQELSCCPILVGTPGSLCVHTTVMDQPPGPALCLPTLCSLGFFSYPIFRCLSADPGRVHESHRTKRSSKPAVWAAGQKKIRFCNKQQTHTLATADPQPPRRHKCQGLSLGEQLVDSPRSDGREAPRTGEVSDCTTYPQSLQGNNLGTERP